MKPPARAKRRVRSKPEVIAVIVEDSRWKKPLVALARRAAAAALAHTKSKGTLTILLTSDARLRELNHDFRGKDLATNVLSFPARDEKNYLGDIAIGYGICVREAKAAGKTLAHHTAHLAVHGVLHLLGHDHEKPRQADTMEALEARILATLGIADPYAAREAA